MRIAHLLAAATLFAAGTAVAETPGEAVQRLRTDAQFDQARSAEFTKFANEDEAIVRSREAQANDLDNNSRNYLGRATWHRQLASRFGNNAEQNRLAAECESLASELTRMAIDRRALATQLQAHVNQFRQWAKNLDARARRSIEIANQLQNAGRL